MSSEYFGPGVSRTLSASQRQFDTVIWQKGKPPLDAELNLMSQMVSEQISQLVQASSHSGFLLDLTQPGLDYTFDQQLSNAFYLGRSASGESAPVSWALVHGMLVPVVGTGTPEGDVRNLVRLNPPPASDSRIDLVFLEVWRAVLAPNASTANKPSASTLWKYGNVEYGGTNVVDDLTDPTLTYETTERVQVQYRIRVFGAGAGAGTSVALDVYPEGLDDPNVLGQGAASAPVAGMVFENMRGELGDPFLWRAGDGDASNNLGTVDGYVYAVPICAIFRRNSSPHAAVESSGAANQNGSLDRNPSASVLPDPRDGARLLASATLTAPISESSSGTILVTNLEDSGIDDSELDLASTFLVVDDEIIGPLTLVSSNSITIAVSGARGRGGSAATSHAIGASVRFYCPNPSGRYADEVHPLDLVDLRHGVGFGGMDSQQVLLHNLGKLFQGELRTSYKVSATGETQGVQVVEVSYLSAAASPPSSSIPLDGPDGIRTVFSDAAAIQSDVTVLCSAPSAAGTVAALDAGVEWDVGADFKPSGFMTGAGYANGSSIFLNIGGTDGQSGARGTFRDAGTQAVRFVPPREFWRADLPDASTGLQTPVRVRFLEAAALQPAAFGEDSGDHPGPMYPTRSSNFERPFIVLGGVVNAATPVSGAALANNSPASGEYEVDLPGLDFDASGGWYPGSDVTSLDPSEVTFPVLRGEKTLFDLLTRGGLDRTGGSSELYLVVYGDSTNAANNGAFQVIGAGTVGYTTKSASASDRVRVRFLSQGVSAFTLPSAGTLVAELRTQYTNAEDGTGGSANPPSSLAIVWTDIAGASSDSRWSGALTAPVQQKMVISTTLQYHPGRGATARVADQVLRVVGVGLGGEYLREATSAVDPTFPAQSGETNFGFSHVQTWNRLPSLGLSAPDAPSYGGGIAADSEQTRESEVFLDRGSKTLVLRPLLDRSMTLQARTSTASGADTLIGASSYSGPVPAASTPKDGAGLWTTGLHMGFDLPPEYVPRFGRQDIPYRRSSSGLMPGINHLFTDSSDVSEAQHYVIGGQDSTSTTIRPLFIQTGSTSGLDYGVYGTITGPGTPAYQGTIITLPNVVSSDLGRGMVGIMLPPYVGVARLYGVYDRRDFVAKGGATYGSDRVTPASDPATNLMRQNASKQTLFILRGGAEEYTGNAEDHTYVIPSDAIDHTLSPEYVDGEEFGDLEYVLELSCFGFARGFISQNNVVLCRRHRGSVTIIADSSDPEAAGARMMINAAAPADSFYAYSLRTPYQGDPYMTRAGSTRVTSDYQARYGQVPVTGQHALTSPIQQYDADGERIPETPNRRVFQILASLDFHTTLGTGKVGGRLYAGTPLDVGYTQDTPEAAARLPETSASPAWRVLPRAYTQGQGEAATRASLEVLIADNASLSGETLTVTVPNLAPVSLEAGTDFAVGGSASASAANLAAALLADPVISQYLDVVNVGTASSVLSALSAGSSGNEILVSTSDPLVITLLPNRVVRGVSRPTSSTLLGGADDASNAGNGTSQLDLTGMTERLPLGILLQDSDFLGESPLNDSSSAMRTQPPGIQPVQILLPLADDGKEYTRLLGGAGQWVALSDGGVLEYVAFNEDTAPTGTKKFRIYRGGGAAFVVSDPVPGAPIDWVAGSFPANLRPVLKGGVLVCRAMLVRNLPETAFSSREVSPGDEVQMIVLTYGHLGDGSPRDDGVNLDGLISPTGYGEGYAAADRYRIEGKPSFTGRVRAYPDADAEPAAYPGGGAEPI